MAVTDDYARVPLNQILVDRDDRQRREINVSDLLESIRIRGVLSPIFVSRELFSPPYKLIAGERRLRASQELGLEDIPVRFVEEMSQIELAILELEENVKRKDLPWQDLVNAVSRIHKLHLDLDSTWTKEETADSISLQRGTVALYLLVANSLKDDRVAKAATIRDAYSIVTRQQQRLAGDALEELVSLASDFVSPMIESSSESETPADTAASISTQSSPGNVVISPPARFSSPSDVILHEDFLQWAPRYTGKKFNFVHCDFPYGIGVFNGVQSGRDTVTTYDDSKDVYVRLLNCFCENLDRFMSLSSNLIFWYSDRNRDLTLQIFKEKAPSLIFYPFPLIWMKSDGAGIASDPRRHPRHTYETALFATRGNRHIIKVIGDSYVAPTDKRFHPSTKPEPVLRHFLSMVVDETTSILDPTCGAGSAIRVAEELGASRLLGMDTDETMVGTARQVLGSTRTLRTMAKASQSQKNLGNG